MLMEVLVNVFKPTVMVPQEVTGGEVTCSQLTDCKQHQLFGLSCVCDVFTVILELTDMSCFHYLMITCFRNIVKKCLHPSSCVCDVFTVILELTVMSCFHYQVITCFRNAVKKCPRPSSCVCDVYTVILELTVMSCFHYQEITCFRNAVKKCPRPSSCTDLITPPQGSCFSTW